MGYVELVEAIRIRSKVLGNCWTSSAVALSSVFVVLDDIVWICLHL
jgi:hypothetical protein